MVLVKEFAYSAVSITVLAAEMIIMANNKFAIRFSKKIPETSTFPGFGKVSTYFSRAKAGAI